MRIIGNDQKNNGQNFWEILERIIGKILSIIGAGLVGVCQLEVHMYLVHEIDLDVSGNQSQSTCFLICLTHSP